MEDLQKLNFQDTGRSMNKKSGTSTRFVQKSSITVIGNSGVPSGPLDALRCMTDICQASGKDCG